MSRKITVTLSDKAETYFNLVKATLDRGEGDLLTNSQIISEILEVNADFETLTEDSLCNWIDENFPLHYKETGY